MRPLKLTVKGFTSFKDEVNLDFGELDLFVISGATGAGKSSLLDAMTYALFGQVPRTNDHGLKELISQGRDRMAVVLDFQVGGQPYRVTRGRRRTGATQVQLEKLNGTGAIPVADKVRTVEEEVRGLLGLGFDAFTQAVVLPQGQFAAFLKCKPHERREMLNGLLRLKVYERMRGLAGARESAQETKKAALERRLREDFDGVTGEAISQLERREQELQREVDESGRRLAALRQRLTEVRRDHDKTRELSSREQELAALQACQTEIKAKGRRLEEAGRAAVVIPLLDQADRARHELLRRAGELAQAVRDYGTLEDRHRLAQDALAEARKASAALPGLRDRQGKLAEVVGMLPHRDQLAQQCAAQRATLQQQRERRGRQDARCQKLVLKIESLGDQLAQTREEIARIGYDPELDQKLAGARDRAHHLRADRRRLEKEARHAGQKGQEAEKAATASREGATQKDRATGARVQADQQLAAARAALEQARAAHAAAHLRSGLGVGQPCPVCQQEVTLLPGAEPVPLLEELAAAVGQAELAAQGAAEEATKQVERAAAAQATALNTRRQADEAQAALRSLTAAVAGLEEELEKVVGESVAGFPGPTIEDRTLAAIEAVSDQRQKHANSTKTASTLEFNLGLKQQEAESARTEVENLTNTLAEAEEQLRRLEEALERLREEIWAVTAADDPKQERESITEQIARLEKGLVESADRAAEAARLLEGGRGKVEQLQKVTADADRDAETANEQAAGAVRRRHFPDAAAARAAALPPDQMDDFRAQIERHQQAIHAAHTRITELAWELDGRRTSDAELAQAEQEHAAGQAGHQATQKEQAVVGEKLRTLAEKLARADELRRELDECHRQHRIYHRLAGDLQSDCFQSYLLEEALGELVQGASQQLSRLTGDRYGLDYVEDQIVVIDRDNAGERRSTDTLSGGETFLASLSLALELSAQVQRAVGAIHLDCLFIEEGFGTLDPETLRVVADAVRSLQVGGRMVGIITHIPELREEFDQRLLVEKEAGASRVRIDNT
jgi:exonuclease SbcC